MLERLVLECTVGGVGRDRFLAWVPGKFQAHEFDRAQVTTPDTPYLRPTGRFWWVHEQVQGADGPQWRDGIAFQRPGVETAQDAFVALAAGGGAP